MVTYSAGGGDVTASDPGLRVNDGRYHVARVSRSDGNVTLWLDDRTAFARGPKGTQLAASIDIEIDAMLSTGMFAR